MRPDYFSNCVFQQEGFIMIVSHTADVEGSEIVATIGRIQAASGWHASGTAPQQGGDWRLVALQRLIHEAKDCEADAVVEVDYEVDGVRVSDLTDIAIERVRARGVAVRLARAA
jgi:uncharacterized protein YbjQ (UPF0145 family)